MTERYSQLSVDVTMQLTDDHRERFAPVFLREEADEIRTKLMRQLEQKEAELRGALERIVSLERSLARLEESLRDLTAALNRRSVDAA